MELSKDSATTQSPDAVLDAMIAKDAAIPANSVQNGKDPNGQTQVIDDPANPGGKDPRIDPKKEPIVLPKDAPAAEPGTASAAAAPAKVDKPVDIKVEKTDEATLSYLKTLDDPADPADKTIETTVAQPAATEKKIITEFDEATKNKLALYDQYEAELNDPFVKTIIDFRKKGVTDFGQIQKELGIVDPATLTVEAMYNRKAEKLGLKGEDLKSAVDEQMTAFDTKTKIEQAEIINSLRETAKAEQAEKFKTFATERQSSYLEQQKVERETQKVVQFAAKTARTTFDTKINDLVNKKWYGLPITKELGQAASDLVMNYSMPVLDDKGKFLGYETDDALEFALWKVAKRKLLKANVEIGKNIGMEIVMNERNRVSQNDTVARVNLKDPENSDEAFKDVVRSGASAGVSLSNPNKVPLNQKK